MKADIRFTKLKNEIILHPNSVNGAQWVAKHLTTNVTDIHYTDEDGIALAEKTFGLMREDGLTVTERMEGEIEPDEDCDECGGHHSPDISCEDAAS